MYDLIFFRNVVKLMNEQNMSRNELHKLSGVSVSLISAIANAEGNPSLLTMEKIADAFGVSLLDLLTPPNPDEFPELKEPKGKRWETIPAGYSKVSAVLPDQKAFTVRKWDNEARKTIRRLIKSK